MWKKLKKNILIILYNEQIQNEIIKIINKINYMIFSLKTLINMIILTINHSIN